MHEIWKPVVGFEGHREVSNMGRVRNVARSYIAGREKLAGGRSTMSIRQRIMSTWINKRGYQCVAICKPGISNVRVTHRVVAEAFIGPAPSSAHQVNHIDGNKLNNRASNLEWATPQQNSQHAYDTGLRVSLKGAQVHTAKLNPDKVREIRVLLASGVFHSVLAKRYGVSKPQISYILNRKTWAHVE